MSANNWGACPRCKLRVKDERRVARDRANRSYGKVSQEKYLALCQEANDLPDPGDTLREDWEIGITDDGLFFVLYRCVCQQCSFEHCFKYEDKLKVIP